MKNLSMKFRAPPSLKKKKGVALAEYALLIALIALVVYAALVPLGTTLSTQYQNFATSVANAG